MAKHNWFTTTLTDYLKSSGAELSEILTYQDTAEKLLEAKQFPALKDTLKEIRSKYNKFNGTSLDEYIRTLEDIRSHSKEMPSNINLDPVVQALIPEIVLSGRHQLYYLQNTLNYEQIKTLIRNLYFKDGVEVTNIAFPDKRKMLYFISNEKKIKGRVVSKVFKSKKDISLCQLNEIDGELTVTFFGEPIPSFRHKEAMKLSFYIYRFESEDQRNYILLSEKELDIQNSEIQGMEVEFSDATKISDQTKLKTQLPVFFVSKQKPEIFDITEKQFKDATQFWDEETLPNLVFGGYRHPKKFEKLILAWLFSAKLNNYPLHLGILAKAGTGKSYLLNSLQQLFNERVIEGGTLKGLIPNFGGSAPDEGSICKSRRLALIDEFFSLLRRAKRTGEVDGGTDTLTGILEHQVRNQSSGKGEDFSITVNPTAKCVFISNTKAFYGLETMPDICRNLNNPFLSRVFWLIQDEEHVDYINKNKTRITMKEASAGKKLYPEYNPMLIQIFDYLNKKTIDFGQFSEQIKQIFDFYMNKIPSECQEIYQARYEHHIFLLFDGLVKINSIMEKREAIKPTQKDVDELEIIFSTAILSWTGEMQTQYMTWQQKLNTLTRNQNKLYDQIRARSLFYELKDFTFEPTITFDMDKLLTMGLVRQYNGKLHSYDSTPGEQKSL